MLVLFGVLAGEAIGGIPGMFFSVPVLAIVKIVYNQMRDRHQKQTRHQFELKTRQPRRL